MKKSDENIWLAVLGDPDAVEAKWYEAALRLSALNRQPGPWWYRLSWQFPLLVTVLISVLGSYACCAYVDLSFDWGYRLVEQLCGQPGGQASNQGIFAIVAIAHLIFPLNLGLSFACARRYFGDRHHWLRTLLGTMAAANLFWFALVDQHFEVVCLFLIAFNLAVAVLSMAIGTRVINRFYTYWNLRLGGFINVRRVFPYCAIYLIPSLIVAIASVFELSIELPLPLEITLYCLPLFLIGLRVYRPSGSLVIAVLSSSMIMAPVLISAFVNLFGTGICLGLDAYQIGPDLGWRATFSALFITAITAGATTLGCLAGAFLVWLEKYCTARSGHGSTAPTVYSPWSGPSYTNR